MNARLIKWWIQLPWNVSNCAMNLTWNRSGAQLSTLGGGVVFFFCAWHNSSQNPSRALQRLEILTTVIVGSNSTTNRYPTPPPFRRLPLAGVNLRCVICITSLIAGTSPFKARFFFFYPCCPREGDLLWYSQRGRFQLASHRGEWWEECSNPPLQWMPFFKYAVYVNAPSRDPITRKRWK